jgi:hypothetical protein
MGVDQSLFDENATEAMANKDEGLIWELLIIKLERQESQCNNGAECNIDIKMSRT